jgi:hypothetical protein
MSLVSKIEYDAEKEAVIAYPSRRLDSNKAFQKAYKRLYNSYPLLTGHCSGPGYDTRYWSEQEIVILDEKHIDAINSVGLDAVLSSGVYITVVPKDYLNAVKRQDNDGRYIGINVDRVVLFDLMKRLDISYEEYLKMCNKASSGFYLENRNKIRYMSGIAGISDDDSVSF